MRVTFDPRVGECEIGKSPELPVGEVEGEIPRTPEQVGVSELHLAENALTLAVAQAAGDRTCRLLNNAENDRDVARFAGHRLERDLDITEQ